MSQPLLTVVAEMTAKPGKEEELKQHLLAMVEASRKEEGCVQYDLHLSIDRLGQFVFYENWASREALDKHSQSAHIQAFRSIAPDLLDGLVRIDMYTRIA